MESEYIDTLPTPIKIDTHKPILLIDASYFIFYRYYCIVNWWNKQGNTIPDNGLMSNPEFAAKYEKMFEQCLRNLVKVYDVPWENVVFAKDCPRESIWRFQYYTEYKGTRDDNRLDNFDRTVFIRTFTEVLPRLGCQVLSHRCLEADDIVAILTRNLATMNPDNLIVIITNDNDYVQLLDETKNIIVVNLQGKQLRERIEIEDKSKYIIYKTITGDKSDNIPSIAKKCGPKTALKMAEDPSELEALFRKNHDAKTQFELNSLLMNFDKIPKEYTDQVLEFLIAT